MVNAQGHLVYFGCGGWGRRGVHGHWVGTCQSSRQGSCGGTREVKGDEGIGGVPGLKAG